MRRLRRGGVLASARGRDGETVAGTRDALVVTTPDGERSIRWEEVEAADWDSETETLRVSEVGRFGEQRVEHAFVLEEPALLLQLVRERVTASVVLQRHVPVDGRGGLRVVARRAPRGDRPISWLYEYDEGVDPTDPTVRAAAERALAVAREEVGPGPDLPPSTR